MLKVFAKPLHHPIRRAREPGFVVDLEVAARFDMESFSGVSSASKRLSLKLRGDKQVVLGDDQQQWCRSDPSNRRGGRILDVVLQ